MYGLHGQGGGRPFHLVGTSLKTAKGTRPKVPCLQGWEGDKPSDLVLFTSIPFKTLQEEMTSGTKCLVSWVLLFTYSQGV